MGKITKCEDVYDSQSKYKEYIRNHIHNVQEVFTKYFINSDYTLLEDVFPSVYSNSTKMMNLRVLIKHHDLSKSYYDEFWPYVFKFFPPEIVDDGAKNLPTDFDYAWLHHVNNNPHHPAYWILYEDNNIKIFDMPDIYIIEMMCDWMAMSKYHNTRTLDYWNSESAKKLPMSEYTKSKVNEFMEWMTKNIPSEILW